MNDHQIPASARTEQATGNPARHRINHCEDLAAIITRADHMGIAVWRVATALQISPPELETIKAPANSIHQRKGGPNRCRS